MANFKIKNLKGDKVLFSGGAEDYMAAADKAQEIAEEKGHMVYLWYGDRAPVRIGVCQGHEAGPYDQMGRTVYCDGTCRS